MIYQSKGIIKTSHEGLMIGNGMLGVLIYGTDNLLLSLDKVNLWDNRLPKEYKDKNFNYDYLLEMIKDGKYDEDNIFDKSYLQSYPTKLNGGILKFGHKVEDEDLFALDLSNGTVSIKGNNIDFFGYIDANKDVMVFRFNKDLDYEIEMPKYFSKRVTKSGLGYKPFEIRNDGCFKHVFQKMYGKHCCGIVIHESIQGSVKQLLLTIYQDDGYEAAKQTLLDYLGKEDINYKEHNNWWDNYYGTSDITTCDDEINRLFNFGRYYFGCNSRKDYPMTLQGVWTRNNGELPPWKADLHNDINTQMTYEGYLKLGNYQEGRVFVDWMIKHKPAFKKFAKNFVKSEGLLVPGDCTQQGTELCGWPHFVSNPGCSIWVIKAFYDYYCYTKDVKFLRKEAYPFFAETEKCIFNILELNENNKYQFKVLHTSPEYFENDSKALFKHQTNFELTMLRYLYTRLIEMGKILRKDVSHYEEVLSKLADYYRDENGLLVISSEQKYDMSHRHFSHMLMYKNMELVDPFINKDIIQKDIAHLESYGPVNWVGFSPVECSELNSYIRNGEQAYKHLKDYSCFTYDNGFHMNYDCRGAGYTDFGHCVLTLEANVGYLKAVSDMFIQNFEDKLVIFPAVADKLKTGGVSFKNLRTFGNHKVSGECKNGKAAFDIELNKKETIKLFNNLCKNPVFVIDGKKHRINAELDEFIVIKAKKSISYEDK